MYDAVGRLITDVGAELAALPDKERPARVTVVVLTDGHENSSREWTHKAVSKAIGRQERDYAWDFVFLGANMDAVVIGQQLGFAADRALTYAADGDGVGGAWAATAKYMARRNAAPAASRVEGFSEDDRAGARGNR